MEYSHLMRTDISDERIMNAVEALSLIIVIKQDKESLVEMYKKSLIHGSNFRKTLPTIALLELEALELIIQLEHEKSRKEIM